MSKSRYWQLLLAMILFTASAGAQDIIPLWEDIEMPFHIENSVKEYEKEAYGVICVFKVTDPELTVYKAKGENSGKAVILLPGGGYTLESIYHEGHNLAKHMAQQGITAAVLKYRLPDPETSDAPHMVPITDTRRALRLLDEKAEKYGINKDEIGVMGFSAGSHLATITSLWLSENKVENPDFSALIYGVTDLSKDNQRWLEECLYHREMTKEEIAQNTLLNLVNNNTPPAFLVHAYDDNVCNVKESTLYAQQLVDHDILVEMHLFPKGGHGFGMGRAEDGTDQWMQLFINWLKTNNFKQENLN